MSRRPEIRDWYGSARWKARRRRQLASEPLCRMCDELGVVTAATVADHVEPHRGDAEAFWFGALQSLCERHHNRDKKLAEHGRPLLGVDADGWPLGRP